jgi:hypothetical protein
VRVTAGRGTATQRLRLTAPPGAAEICIPLAPGCRGEVKVDGRPLALERTGEGELRGVLGDGGPSGPAPCEITVEPAPGLSRGAVLTGPVTFTVGPGRMALLDWQRAGLVNHSGGVRVRSPDTFDLSGHAGVVTLEALVLNTLGPHVDAISRLPTSSPASGSRACSARCGCSSRREA